MSKSTEFQPQWLPWLDDGSKSEIAEMIDAASIRMSEKNWGSVTDHEGIGPYEMRVRDIHGIVTMTAGLRSVLKKVNTTVYYRGQNRAHKLVPTLFRQKSNHEDRVAALQTMTNMLDHVKKHFSILVDEHTRAALAQHYGCPTNWLDIVDTPQMASWFAYHENTPSLALDDVGYIYLLCAPRVSESTHVQVMDLRDSWPMWLRPHMQQAFSIRAIPADGSIGSLDHVHLMTYIVPRQLLKDWSAYDVLTPATMFPSSAKDIGRHESNTAQTLLNDSEWKGIWHDPEFEIISR